MDADANHSGHERVMLFCMDHHAVQAIIIQDPVVDPLRCRPLVINPFISFCPAWDLCVQADIPFRPGLDDPAVFRRSTAVFTFCTMVFPERAPPHEVAAGLVIAVWDHAFLLLTDGGSVPVNGYGIRNRLRSPALIVQVDKRPDVPAFQETVSRVIVHGGVEADIFDGKSGHMFFQFMESNEKADRIMSLSAGKAKEEREVRFQSAVITGELEECIAEVKLFQVAVPSPGSIRVREVAQSFGRVFPVVSARAGVGMDGSAIAGNSQVFLWDQAAFDGRENGGMVKEKLEPLLKMKRNVPAIHQAVGNEFCNFGLAFLRFLLFAFRFFRFFVVPGGRKELITGVSFRFRCSPETVHEVKIGTERGQGIRGTTDEGSKDAVVFEPVYP